MKNENNELIPTRVTKGWCMCINYKKLNVVNRKDHFPLSFLDQILEKVVCHAYYCFLDGYLGYYQIEIAPEDQEKTIFTCPFELLHSEGCHLGYVMLLTVFRDACSVFLVTW